MPIEAAVELPPRAESVSAARRFVATSLRAWQLDQLLDVVVLLTSELVTNAVIHANSPVRVSMTRDGEEVVLAVADTSQIPVRVRQHDTVATTGRGMRLVAALSLRWGVVENTPGKEVWCALPLDPNQLPDPTLQEYLDGPSDQGSRTRD